MNAFDSLKNVIRALSPHQRRIAKKFIQTFDPSVASVQMFELIENLPKITLEAFAVKTKNSGKSVLRKALRVREKVEESLLLNIGLERADLSEWFKAKIEVRKAFLQAFSIWNEKDEVQRLFDKIEEKAEKYECFDELIEMLRWRQHVDALNNGLSNYWSLNERIEGLERKRKAANMGLSFYSFHYGNAEDKGYPNENVGELTKMISTLEPEYDATLSTVAGHYLFRLKMEYHAALGEAKIVFKIGHKLLNLIKENQHLFRKNKIYMTYAVLAEHALANGEFEAALHYSEHALVGLQLDRNIILAKLNQVYCHIHLKDHTIATDTISDIYRAFKQEDEPLIFEELEYLCAYISFTRKEYQICLTRLNRLSLLMNDVEGWNVGIRILEVQCLFELKEDQLASTRVEAMRKHVVKYADISSRNQCIFKILRKVAWFRGNFEAILSGEVEENLEQMLDSPWSPKTPELVPFEKWLETKASHLNIVLAKSLKSKPDSKPR
jgi:hypothetical protein